MVATALQHVGFTGLGVPEEREQAIDPLGILGQVGDRLGLVFPFLAVAFLGRQGQGRQEQGEGKEGFEGIRCDVLHDSLRVLSGPKTGRCPGKTVRPSGF